MATDAACPNERGDGMDGDKNEYDGFFWFMLAVGIIGVVGFVMVAGAGA